MPDYTQEQVDRWLGHLAAGMKQHRQTVFQIEQLQPDWLPRPWQRWAYLLASRALETTLFLYLFSALLQTAFRPGMDRPLSLEDSLLWMPLRLACYGPLLGIGFAWVDTLAWSPGVRWTDRAIRLLFAWCLGVLVLFALGRSFLFTYQLFLLNAIFTLFFYLRSTDHPLREDIRTVQALVWSWRRALIEGGWRAVLVALVVAPLIGFADKGNVFPVFTTFFAFLALSAMLWPVLGFFLGLQPGVLELATSPNQGIRLSLRNAWVAGALSLALVLPSHWLILLPFSHDSVMKPFTMALSTGVVTAMIAILRYGQLDILRHYTLRLALAATGRLPWRLPRFLGYAANELHLLQPAGGGFLFLHRYLFDYFATLESEGGAAEADRRISEIEPAG